MIDILLFVLGLVFGSFFSAISWRNPRDISFVKGRSICPVCKKQIAWYDNIPLLSFVFLLGKCRHCHKRISIRYPITELVTGVGFLLIGTLQADPITVFYNLSIFSILVIIFVIDFEHQIIPDSLVFLAIFMSFGYLLIKDSPNMFLNVLSGLIASVFLLILNVATKGRGMGLGDVKFAVFAGMFLGPNLLFIWFLVAFLTGALVGIILILGKRAGLKDHIAFGPFLILSILIVKLYGDKIMGIVLP